MRLRLIVASLIAAGCASAGPPPGGPEDRVPPRLVRITPDSNAVNVGAKAATFFFNETINDRGTGTGDLSNFFLVSPSDGAPRVSWHRARIDVRPRHGFRPNTAYTITLLPGLTDLRNNTMKTGANLVFATGATIPTLRIAGVAFDWVAERGAPRALIEAITPDSIVYIAQSDSVGRFSVGPLNPGTYLLRATIDQNSNRALDRGEAWDSVRVTAPQSGAAELLAVIRDTLPARILSVSLADSITLHVTFDRLLDPSQPFTVASFRLIGADSVVVSLTAVRTPRDEAELAKVRQQQAVDSARRADSLAGRPRPAAPAAAARPTAADSVPKPSRPAPFTGLTLVLGRTLAPSTNYRLSVTTVKSLSGRTSGSERTFTTPRPPPPPKADSTTRPPTVPATAPPTSPPAAPPASRP